MSLSTENQEGEEKTSLHQKKLVSIPDLFFTTSSNYCFIGVSCCIYKLMDIGSSIAVFLVLSILLLALFCFLTKYFHNKLKQTL